MSGSSTPVFLPGNLVISVYGDGADDGTYTDNQAAPIVLEQVTTSGVAVSRLELPETTTVVNGVTESAISGEYGSSSEGTLELSADGQSLVIAGYGINDVTYNQGGAKVYGDARLAQSTSVKGGKYVAVPRVIADIRADGSVDTSTSLYNVFNTNNPRSVATVDGSTFYIAGQGKSGDGTQGVFTVRDGATTATAIDTSTDARTVEIQDGALYVSRDSKQGTGGTSNLSDYGTGLPTSATAPATLAGISGSVVLAASQENSVDASAVGTSVALSPENFFFANATTLYIADSGNPKEGTLGDGGLQKWTLDGSAWHLDYTLSAGLDLVANTASAGTTGLIGLTGKVVGDSVQLYATNATINDLDQTYLYGITDTLSATTDPGESFTTLVSAAADTNIRGVSFTPTDATACYARGTRIRTARGEVAVEALQAGDVAITRAGGEDVPARIVWIGRRTIDLAAHPRPELVRPVHVAPGALGDGVPARTLVLSPDHALLLDGMLIAVRQLVNGGSIAVHRPGSVQYFHVELERHGILLAEGAEAESYLDTGNRGQFSGSSDTIALHADFSRTGNQGACEGACADLVTDPSLVRPVWQRLAERSVATGHALPSIATTSDAALRLVLADGRVLLPSQVRPDGRHVYLLDGAAGPIRVRSRHASPAASRPWQDDRRALGVAIGEIEFWCSTHGLTPTRIALDDGALSGGWWTVEGAEPDGWRWTDGDATLDLPAGGLQLALRVVASGNYPVMTEQAA